MYDIRKYAGNAESELAPYLRGALTRASLARALTRIRSTTEVIVTGMPMNAKRNLVNHVRMYIAPKDLAHTTLTAAMVVESWIVNLLIDEYFTTLASQPRLKMQFWNELENDGLNFNMWSGVQRAMGG